MRIQSPLCRDDGVGLAAPQVGVNVRLMVFNETGQRGSRKEQVWVGHLRAEHGLAYICGVARVPLLYS